MSEVPTDCEPCLPVHRQSSYNPPSTSGLWAGFQKHRFWGCGGVSSWFKSLLIEFLNMAWLLLRGCLEYPMVEHQIYGCIAIISLNSDLEALCAKKKRLWPQPAGHERCYPGLWSDCQWKDVLHQRLHRWPPQTWCVEATAYSSRLEAVATKLAEAQNDELNKGPELNWRW